MRCEPTYKELKHCFVKDVMKEIAGCEPTYKELKQLEAELFEMKKKGCEPTYKELKQFVKADAEYTAEPVASLPIRNWNF